MAAPNLSKPVVGDNYADVLPYIVDNIKGVIQAFDPAVITGGGTPTGTPTGAVRWNSANKYWEKYNGSTWAALESAYAIAITGNAGTVTNGVYTSGSYSNPAWITALAWSKLTSTPTTLAGYGIADAITAAAVAAGYAAKATTLAGYSIADAAPLSHVGTGGAAHANAVAAGAAGFLTGADKTKLDNTSGTNTGDQTITLTGDVTGSGTGSFAATIANRAVTLAKFVAATATDVVLGRSTSGSGSFEEIACTATGRSVLAAANAAAARTALGIADKVVQSVYTNVATSTTGTTAIPQDDTIPQNTEGDQYMSLAITPTSASNRLRITVSIALSNSAGGMKIAALFQDSTANALAVAFNNSGAANAPVTLTLIYTMTAGTTSATTFKVRGGGTAGTTTFNGGSSARLFGGACVSSIHIDEIAV